MKGSGHISYVHDEQKALARQAVLDGRLELSPKQLLEQLGPDWVNATRAHQEALAGVSLSDMVSRPYVIPDREIRPQKGKELTPEELDKNQRNQEIRENIRIAANNTEVYEDAVEDEMDQDPILAAMYSRRADFVDDESYSEALRVRRTLVAHGIYMAIVELVSASDTAA